MLANLLHLSHNMWSDVPPGWSDTLQCDDAVWADVTERMPTAGFDTCVIELGDGVAWRSHPDIAVDDAWSRERLRDELARLRGLGLTPIPSFNFSAAHDAWLRDVGRQVSTDRYYRVCRDLIEEAAELFDGAAYLHLGMDEEDLHNQRLQRLAVIRQHELWWHDLEFLAGVVRDTGSTPWIWSDHAWRIGAEFFERMPTDIVQSNWYYGMNFDLPYDGTPALRIDDCCLTYNDLETTGLTQVPTASTWETPANFDRTVEYCREVVAPERLLGFLQTTWKPMTARYHRRWLDAIEAVAESNRAGSLSRASA